MEWHNIYDKPRLYGVILGLAPACEPMWLIQTCNLGMALPLRHYMQMTISSSSSVGAQQP